MKQTLTIFLVTLLGLFTMAKLFAGDGKKNQVNKPAGTPKIEASHKPGKDKKSGKQIHRISVKITGESKTATTTLYPIYKISSGKGYTCLEKVITLGKKHQGGKTFGVPHTVSFSSSKKATYVDYLIIMRERDDVIAYASSDLKWGGIANTFEGYPGKVFNSRGYSLAKGTGSAGKYDNSLQDEGYSLRNTIMKERANRELYEKVKKELEEQSKK